MAALGNKNVLISLLYVLPIAIASYGMRGKALFSVGYLIYAAAMYLSIRYLVCTKCSYYGRSCLLFGGLVASKLFKMRLGEWSTRELGTVTLLWVILYLFPIVALSFMKSWLLIPFLISIVLFNTFRIGLGCRRCEMKARCPMAIYSHRSAGR